jgi:hypothetical protein
MIYPIIPCPKPRQKVTDEQIIHAYQKTNSVWKAAKILGICGQSVHERLKKIGAISNNYFTEEEKNKIEQLYKKGFSRGDGSLDALCNELKRTKQTVSRMARKLGISDINRPIDNFLSETISRRVKKWYANNEHPRGAAGIKFSEESLQKISIASKKSWANKSEKEKSAKTKKMIATKILRGNLHLPRHKTTWKGGWRKIGGVRRYFRSRWEANYARYLEWQKINGFIKNWTHEPKTFLFEKEETGPRAYLPDFLVEHEKYHFKFHEVKGWMDSRSKIKLERMKKYYPEIEIILIRKKEYTTIKNKLSKNIIGWEA